MDITHLGIKRINHSKWLSNDSQNINLNKEHKKQYLILKCLQENLSKHDFKQVLQLSWRRQTVTQYWTENIMTSIILMGLHIRQLQVNQMAKYFQSKLNGPYYLLSQWIIYRFENCHQIMDQIVFRLFTLFTTCG